MSSITEDVFIAEVRMAIQAALKVAKVSHAELARQLGVTEARVSQMMRGNGKNLQLRTIARIAHVLGLKPIIDLV